MTRLYLRCPTIPSFMFPFSSFLSLMDLKNGCAIVTLFALFNKIAGVYGILAIFSGGTLAQLSLYLYSILSIVGLLWGFRAISEEVAPSVLTYAHLFTLDHLISTFWVLVFGLDWFVYTPHDGARPKLAPHQAGLMDLIESIEKSYEKGTVKHHVPLEGEQRRISAEKVWAEEKGFSAGIIIFGWLVKIYFALVLYSFALHLRHGTYRSLPLSKLTPSPASQTRTGPEGHQYHPVQDVEEELPAWSDDEEEGGEAAAEPNAASSNANPNSNSKELRSAVATTTVS